ncbi:hypothetical protein Goari_010557 [Gossypium aridum]|uniref:Uncharacterized protein n=1 Tax=Gossypium aridum TaxID=34290 RepID=A0A7J8Y1Y9_GOSAI|nr:hypothetical protein [Gossypium aridum]
MIYYLEGSTGLTMTLSFSALKDGMITALVPYWCMHQIEQRWFMR